METSSRAPARTSFTTAFGTPYPPRAPLVVAAKTVVTTRPRPSTTGPPLLPGWISPRTELIDRRRGPAP